jgi:hypothetical protein
LPTNVKRSFGDLEKYGSLSNMTKNSLVIENIDAAVVDFRFWHKIYYRIRGL